MHHPTARRMQDALDLSAMVYDFLKQAFSRFAPHREHNERETPSTRPGDSQKPVGHETFAGEACGAKRDSSDVSQPSGARGEKHLFRKHRTDRSRVEIEAVVATGPSRIVGRRTTELSVIHLMGKGQTSSGNCEKPRGFTPFVAQNRHRK